MTVPELRATSIFAQEAIARKIGVKTDPKGKLGGAWMASEAGTSHFVMFDSQGMGRFMADSESDPLLVAKPYSGKTVMIPVQSN
jgi:hypothetical protein